MNNNILVINPWIYDFKGFDEWSKPLGLLYISSILEKEGYNISFINCLDRNHPDVDPKYNEDPKKYGCGKFPAEEIEKPNIFKGIKRKYKRYGISEETFIKELKNKPKPTAVIAGALITFWYEGLFRVIEIIKEIYPDVPVIIGGIYVTLCFDHAQLKSNADYIVKGNNPNDIVDILEKITEQKRKYNWENFSDYPTPAYHLLNNPSAVPVMTSMGCPFRCVYCASSILNKRFQSADPRKLADEFSKEIEDMKLTDIAFYDDALLVDYKRRTGPYIDRLIENGYNFRYHTPNAMHAKYITEEVAESLKRHGFISLRIGFEFIDDQMQKKTGGKTTTQDLINASKALYKAGFKKENIKAYILIGIPNTKPESVAEAIKACCDLGLQTHLSEYSPIPHTPMWKEFPGTDTEESKDPLFHNNTYHIFRGTVISEDDYNKLKTMSRSMNKL